MDGRLQHIQRGQVMYECAGLAHECCDIALAAGGRVVLAATGTGSVVSIGWPQDPAAADAASDEQELSLPGSRGGTPRSSAAASTPPGALRHLTVQVGDAAGTAAGASPSPRSAAGTPHAAGRAAVAGASASGAAATLSGARLGANLRAVLQLQPGWQEHKLHGGRITAMKVLHGAGVLFTARWVVSACRFQASACCCAPANTCVQRMRRLACGA
jgi:hypothetical protein